jgi:predicted DNA-binding transcriptional regulator AlpA
MSDRIREEDERARRSLKLKHSSAKASKSPQPAPPHYLALKSAGVAPSKRRLVKSAPEAHPVARQGDRGDQDGDDDSSVQLLRKRELAALLKVSPWTVDRWRRRGDFPLPLWISPHTPAWRRRDVLAWLSSRQHGGLAPGWNIGRTKPAAKNTTPSPRKRRC